MFEYTGWNIIETIVNCQSNVIVKPQDDKEENKSMKIVRRFDFESKLMRSCVVA